MRFIDPDGRSADDVIIQGDEAKAAFKQLNKSTSLKLKMDENGNVSIKGGKAKTDADKALAAAISSDKVEVVVDATSSNYTEGGNWFVGGAFGGSTVDASGKVTANQTVNPGMTKTLDEFYEKGQGVTVMHEVLEAFIGGSDSPGSGVPKFGEEGTASFTNYQSAHDKARELDPRHKEPNISVAPNGIFVSKLPYDASIPSFLNPEILINDLKR